MGVLAAAMEAGLRSIKVVSTADVWTIESGKVKKDTGKVEFRPAEAFVLLQGSLGFKYQNVLNAAMVIDAFSYAGSTYDNIIRQKNFRDLYQVAQRPIFYVNGVTLGQKTEDSVPCQICGIVVPVTHITIDHMRPQTGGEIEAVAKVFRTLGYTVAGPTGQKSQHLQTAVRGAIASPFGLGVGLQQVQMGVTLPPIPTKPGRGPKTPPTSTVVDRYSLTWEGYLFYSIVKALNCTAELEVRCMNSLINLRPLCGHCNGARGNPLKFP